MGKESSEGKGPSITLVPPTPEQAKRDAVLSLERAVEYACRVKLTADEVRQAVEQALEKWSIKDSGEKQ